MKKSLRVFILVLVCVLVLGAAALAANGYTKQLIANYVGVSLVIDGQLVIPKDINGNTVEPFIVDGTTYLPVRAVAEALGKEVSWDGDSKTVFIGAKTDSGLPEGYAAFNTSDGNQIIYTTGPFTYKATDYEITQTISSIKFSWGYQYQKYYSINYTMNATVTGNNLLKLVIKCYDKDGALLKTFDVRETATAGTEGIFSGSIRAPMDTVCIRVHDYYG